MCICHGVMWWVESILLWQWQCNCIYTHAWDLQLRERDSGSAFKRDSKSQASHKGINLPRPQRKTQTQKTHLSQHGPLRQKMQIENSKRGSSLQNTVHVNTYLSQKWAMYLVFMSQISIMWSCRSARTQTLSHTQLVLEPCHEIFPDLWPGPFRCVFV